MAREANPFEVLELAPTATPIEIERQKQKLLGMLELGLEAAATYPTAGGPRRRDAEIVRAAAERLARPATRLAWELWTPRGGDATGGDRDTVDDALELHAAIATQLDAGLEVSAGELDELGLAWDLAYESEDLADRVDGRAGELGVGDPDAALEAFTGELEDALASMAAAIRADLDDLESDILGAVADRHANELVERLELACERYVSGPADSESWSALCAQYWDVVKGRGEHVRSTAFYAVYAPLSDHAVDLFHAGDHEGAAREFRWLSERASSVGDDEAAARERENAELSASAWLRADERAREVDPSPSSTSWSWLWIVAVVVIAMLRASRGCGSSTPEYKPPPIHFDHDRVQRELQRSIDRSIEQINRDFERDMDRIRDNLRRDLERSLDDLDGFDGFEVDPGLAPPPELPPELPDPPAETDDGRRAPHSPAGR